MTKRAFERFDKEHGAQGASKESVPTERTEGQRFVSFESTCLWQMCVRVMFNEK